MTLRYRFFIILAGFFLLANLLVMNDLTALWPGPESWLAWRCLNGEAGGAPYERLGALIMGQEGLSPFWMRLPGAAVFALALAGYWVISRKLFESEVLLTTLLVFSASLLAPNMAKVATGDIWAMATQWLAFAAMVRFLKQPALVWRLAFYGLLFLALWAQPLNALIFLMGSGAYLYFRHPQGKRLWSLNPWLAGALLFLPLYFLGWSTFGQAGFLVGFRTGRFLLWNLAGMFPFLGFVLAGIWETHKRLGRQEEMAILNAAGLIFALLAHSLALQGVLALVVAKQLKSYFDSKYPYGTIVKTGAILHLVAAFFVIMPLMVGGFLQYQGPGFRAMLAAGGIYWMFSFVAVIGLFSYNQRYLIEGLVLGGLLVTTLFWLQANPLLQQKTGWPRQLVEQSREKTAARGITSSFLVQPGEAPFPALAPYSKAAYPDTHILSGPKSLRHAWETSREAVFLLEREKAEELGTAVPADTIRGWDNRLRAVEYVLLVKK